MTVPAGVTSLVPGNNSATDTRVIIPQSNLAITKTDSLTQVVPGQSLVYTIVVSNTGTVVMNPLWPARVTDTPPAGYTPTSWTCTVSNGGRQHELSKGATDTCNRRHTSGRDLSRIQVNFCG